MYPDRIEPACCRHGNADNSQDEQYCRGQIPFAGRQLSHEAAPSHDSPETSIYLPG